MAAPRRKPPQSAAYVDRAPARWVPRLGRTVAAAAMAVVFCASGAVLGETPAFAAGLPPIGPIPIAGGGSVLPAGPSQQPRIGSMDPTVHAVVTGPPDTFKKKPGPGLPKKVVKGAAAIGLGAAALRSLPGPPGGGGGGQKKSGGKSTRTTRTTRTTPGAVPTAPPVPNIKPKPHTVVTGPTKGASKPKAPSKTAPPAQASHNTRKKTGKQQQGQPSPPAKQKSGPKQKSVPSHRPQKQGPGKSGKDAHEAGLARHVAEGERAQATRDRVAAANAAKKKQRGKPNAK
jgi:hypothetical protein